MNLRVKRMSKYAVVRQSKVDPEVWISQYESRFLLLCTLYMLTHFKPSVWLSDVIVIDRIDEKRI